MPLYKKGKLQDPETAGFSAWSQCWEDHGAHHFECHHVACAKQPADQAQAAWLCEKQSCLTNIISYDKVTHWVNGGKPVDAVCLDNWLWAEWL